ncbi:MAG: putative peptidase [candidate division BRC1 bacterium ADurb.BinA292]|nr:MAG: putative peptidase [candidate division BRC1 bacterium ADurb.BinA292]
MTPRRIDPRGRELARRIQRIQHGLRRRRLDALLVFDRHNSRYLLGFASSLSYLFITPREAVAYFDGRYYEAASTAISHLEVRLMAQPRTAIERWGNEFHPRRIGFEGSTAFSSLEQWRELLPGLKWEECGELIARQRIVKSPAEAKLIERSAAMTDAIFETVIAALRPGMTEWDVRNLIHAEAARRGARSLSFECIVASGATGSRPHYEAQARPLERGDLLLIDMGVVVEGYCSDMTRVVALGRAPRARLRKAYDAVLAAEEAALAEVAPGVACADLDRIAREHIKARRFGRYFTHGLGHGVGLEIHEPPTLNGRSKEVLRAGMVVTIEPGVYLPGLGGVRIEDLVLVTRNGRRVLSRAPKAFRIVPFE